MAIRTKGNPIVLVIVLLIVGLYFFLSNVGDVTRLQSPATPFDTLTKQNIKDGDIVEGDVYFTIGCIAEEYTERNGVRYGTGSDSLYYVIPAGETEYAVMQIKKNLYSSMDNLYNQTLKFVEDNTIPTSPVHFKGKVEKCNSQVELWFYEYMEYFMGASTQSEVEPYIINYTINCKNWDTVYIMFYLGLGLVILSAVILVVMVIVSKARNSYTPVSTFHNENNISRNENSFDWNANVPMPSPDTAIRDNIAPPPAPRSEVMASVSITPDAAPVQATTPSYGGYSAPASTPIPTSVPDKTSAIDISSSASPEVADAFTDLQSDAMKSFAELSDASKDSFNDIKQNKQ